MQPLIDYGLLGRAFDFYVNAGYKPVEVPWAVEDRHVAATLPHTNSRSIFLEYEGDDINPRTDRTLVGSAEQGFLSLDLAPGRYVACTPCFRVEPEHNALYQPWFMKIELYDNTGVDVAVDLMDDARIFMSGHSRGALLTMTTNIGWDLELNGIEVGSYGSREVEGYAPWSYGTGLALPRFDVANRR